jgi:hypothetical protein
MKNTLTLWGERLPSPCDSRHTVLCPTRTHDAPVRVLSCLGSHLFGSDEGRGISFLRCPRLELPRSLTLRLPIGGYANGEITGPVWLNHDKPAEMNGCPVLEHKQNGMGKRIRSDPELRVRFRRMDKAVPKASGKTLHLRVRERSALRELIAFNQGDLPLPNPEPDRSRSQREAA